MATDQLLDWIIELQSIAQAGLTYGKDIYDRERYQRLREIAAEMMAQKSGLSLERVTGLFCNDSGYQTPKLDTRAAIFKDDKILLVHENDGSWSLPGGWVKEKMDLIAKTYTKDNLKNSSYLERVQKTIGYLDGCANERKSKQEIAIEFRDIESVTAIPEEILKQEQVEHLHDRLKQLLAGNNYRGNELEIIELRDKMMDLTVQVPAYLFDEVSDAKVDEVELSRYQKIPVLSSKYNYDGNRGLNIDI